MEIARHWRLKQQRYRLIGKVCPNCEYKMFPPRDVCPNCGGETKIVASSGVVYQKNDGVTASLPTEVSTSSK